MFQETGDISALKCQEEHSSYRTTKVIFKEAIKSHPAYKYVYFIFYMHLIYSFSHHQRPSFKKKMIWL